MSKLCVSFQNPGLIDLRAIEIMGVSSKDSKQPIGFFGTVLKYAIAVLLRTGHSVEVWRGETRYAFTYENETIRNDVFGIVYMNSVAGTQRLGFTTALGRNWEVWMALREVYSNMLDEDGFAKPQALDPKEGFTTLRIWGSDFFDAYAKRGQVFLETKAQVKGDKAEAHSGQGSALFYRGVRVYRLPKPSMFTWNVLSRVILTEDRTLQSEYDARYAIVGMIRGCEDKDFLLKVLRPQKDTYEYDLDYGASWDELSAEFCQAVEELGVRCNPSASRVCRAGKISKAEFEKYTASKVEGRALALAIAFLKDIGFGVEVYPIELVKDLGENVMGLAKNKTIWLAARTLQMGKKQIASTLLEEFVHLELGHEDCTREMQNYLFDRIIGMGEEKRGEPL